MVSRLGSSNLLKPARDLAQNWSIDVASELEAYLTQVEQQHHNARAKDGTSLCSAGNAEDDDQKPFNFIEAALMLQSGTSVYTKKVEYLLALTYETLSHFAVPSRSISSQEGPARRGGKAGGKRYGRGVEDWESLDLFSVPWHVASDSKGESSGFFLTNENETTESINETPYIINTTKESTFPSSATYQRKVLPAGLDNPQLQHVSLLLIPRDDRNDLRVSSLMVHPITGALLVNPQDALTTSDGTGVNSNQGLLVGATPIAPWCVPSVPNSVSSIHATPVPNANGSTAAPSSASVCLMSSTPLPSARQDSIHMLAGEELRRQSVDFGGTGSVIGESTMGRGKTRTSYNEFSTRERYGDTASGSQVKGCREKRSRLPANRLQRLDCHQQMGRDRPQKFGKTSKAPDAKIYLPSAETLPQLQFEVFSELQRLQFTGARWSCSAKFEPLETLYKPFEAPAVRRVSEFPDLKPPVLLAGDHYMLGPTWALLESDFFELANSRLAQHKPPKQKVGDPDDMWEKPSSKEPPLLESIEPFDDVDPTRSDVDVLDGQPYEENTDSAEPVAGEHPAVIDTDIENAVLGAQLSYSDVLQQTLDVSSSRRSTGEDLAVLEDQAVLHQRVAKWRLNVDRWLGVIRERPSFDVVDYKTRFARKLIDADPHHVGSVSFDKAVSGSSRSDICRYFLTTLLLCNDQLVAIDHDKPFSGDNDASHFNLLIHHNALQQLTPLLPKENVESTLQSSSTFVSKPLSTTKRRRQRVTEK